jgi:2-oxoisovalerate dehydrogenase E1 component beta subunit
VEFGGVFRCTKDLLELYGKDKITNCPITEQGIIGFSYGISLSGRKVIGEIQFADYLHPGFDQLINEVSKGRYRSGHGYSCESFVIRAPFGAVGHGGLYHSQSPENFYCIPGLRVLVPSSPYRAKGLILGALESFDPTLIFEPKILYRSIGWIYFYDRGECSG